MLNRIVGLETEFGCLVRDATLGSPDSVVERIKDLAFREDRWGLLDVHTRDIYFEPAESGGFLVNGGRLYIDAVGHHLEYATPECKSAYDLVRYDLAGQRLIQQLIEELGWPERMSIHSNSVDHFGGHTFGCHENYSVAPESLNQRTMIQVIVPFLITRQIYAGAGRVGGHRLTADAQVARRQIRGSPADYVFLDRVYAVEPDPSVSFQVSQRADHILHLISGRVRFSRALINPKWDQVDGLCRAPRLHLLFGEANMSEYAAFLKVGTTALVLDLAEAGVAPRGVELDDPIGALRATSRDPERRWLVKLRNGQRISAVAIQRRYLDAAQRYWAGRDGEIDRILHEWERTLDDLEVEPARTANRLDWTAKQALFRLYMQAQKSGWEDETLQSLDLEYHNIDPRQSLYHAWVSQGNGAFRVSEDDAVERCLREPPPNTRALGRARVVDALRGRGITDYVIEWDGVFVGDGRVLVLSDPFHTYAEEASRFVRRLS